MLNFLEKIKKVPHYISGLKPVPLKAADHDYFNCFLKSKKDIEKLLPLQLKEASILIIGCGYRYPDVLLYSSCSKNVCGLDIQDTFYREGFKSLYDSFKMKNKGVLASLYNTYSKRNGLPKYYKRIYELANYTVNHEDLNLKSYDGKKIPFEADKFDAVLSNAVLEHVTDLESFFFEVNRVTKPLGTSYHLYHNYYSFSGSHLPQTLCEKHPWGHLRGKYQTDPNHLNQVTIDTISKLFSSLFELNNIFQVSKDHSKKGVDENFNFEKEDLLTPDIRNELKKFSDEQLLTRAYLIVGSSKKIV